MKKQRDIEPKRLIKVIDGIELHRLEYCYGSYDIIIEEVITRDRNGKALGKQWKAPYQRNNRSTNDYMIEINRPQLMRKKGFLEKGYDFLAKIEGELSDD